MTSGKRVRRGAVHHCVNTISPAVLLLHVMLLRAMQRAICSHVTIDSPWVKSPWVQFPVNVVAANPLRLTGSFASSKITKWHSGDVVPQSTPGKSNAGPWTGKGA